MEKLHGIFKFLTVDICLLIRLSRNSERPQKTLVTNNVQNNIKKYYYMQFKDEQIIPKKLKV